MININHDLLCSIGVGHPCLTIVRQTSKEFGLACKLTGAGGGGCAITLLKPSGVKAAAENSIKNDEEIAENLISRLRYMTSFF